jgi:choline dehydrogenase-like flavoprotein
MPVCPIGAMYSGDVHANHAEDAGAKIITNATVYKLEKGADNKIVAVHYKTSTGEDKQLTAKTFIVAANGIETPKLLLLSEVGNSNDLVGRHLMDHSGISLIFTADEPLWPGRGQVQQGAIFKWRDGDFAANIRPSSTPCTTMCPTMMWPRCSSNRASWGQNWTNGSAISRPAGW